MRAVLLFPDKLYILTQGWQLYTIKQSIEDIQKHGMNLVNVTPVDMTKQWTAFKNNKTFQEKKDRIELIYSQYNPQDKNDYKVFMNIPNEVSQFEAGEEDS